MNSVSLLIKARRAASSACTLLEAGDADGACDRAYYCMFYGAQIALLNIGMMRQEDMPRTHTGLITLFGQRIVRPGLLPLETGRALSDVHRLRQLADYQASQLDSENAELAIKAADEFLKAVESQLEKEGVRGNG